MQYGLQVLLPYHRYDHGAQMPRMQESQARKDLFFFRYFKQKGYGGRSRSRNAGYRRDEAREGYGHAREGGGGHGRERPHTGGGPHEKAHGRGGYLNG